MRAAQPGAKGPGTRPRHSAQQLLRPVCAGGLQYRWLATAM